MALSHITLIDYYKLIFALKQHHHWSLQELENLWPWERILYTNLLEQHIKEENEKMNNS